MYSDIIGRLGNEFISQLLRQCSLGHAEVSGIMLCVVLGNHAPDTDLHEYEVGGKLSEGCLYPR